MTDASDTAVIAAAQAAADAVKDTLRRAGATHTDAAEAARTAVLKALNITDADAPQEKAAV